MAERSTLKVWVIEALRDLGGTASVLDVSKRVWAEHSDDLAQSGDLFFTWQYDIRWAAQYLRDHGYLLPSERKRNEPWSLTELGRSTDAAEAARRSPKT